MSEQRFDPAEPAPAHLPAPLLQGPAEGDEPHRYQRIAAALRHAIVSGSLRSGQRLSSVRELARLHRVSLSTATLALRTLEDARLIQARPRSGYYVLPRPQRLPEPQAATALLPAQTVTRSEAAARILLLQEDPQYRSFGVAFPEAALFDAKRLHGIAMRVMQRQQASLVSYRCMVRGHPVLQKAIAQHALRLGSQLDWSSIIVTNGCMESVTLALRAVTRPGDTVAIESPTHFSFLDILEQLHLKALEIPTHPRHGMSLDALQLALESRQVNAVLAVPTLSNPLGSCMPQASRQRLARLLAQHQVPLVEDVIWNDLTDAPELRHSVHSHDREGWVLLCGSYTKTLLPGVRLGWLYGPRWTEQLQRMKGNTSGGQTVALELTLAEVLQQKGMELHMRRLRSTFAQRMDDALALVGAGFPEDTRVTNPGAGMLLWIELPPAIDAMQLLQAALKEHICFSPGSLFSPTHRYCNYLRLGLGGPWNAAQRDAISRIGALARQML